MRHLKALMQKNAINWRRTWKGSIFELVCPALLCLLIVWIRTLIEIEMSEVTDVYKEQVPLYPPVNLNPNTMQWVITNNSINAQANRLSDFMDYTGYTGDASNSGTYSPMSDPASPYKFIPAQCMAATNGKTERNREVYDSPIVAYISESNSIETDLVNQLNVLFESQRVNNDKLTALNMRVQSFASKDELFAYIEDSKYGQPEMPAICFGFRLFESDMQTDYELELFFQDLYPSTYESIPNQK